MSELRFNIYMTVFGFVLFCYYFAVVFIVVVVFGFYVSGVGGD